MRKLYILFFLLSLCLGAFSQEITVRFTGQLNGTSYCRLDSVAVTNLTRNWTETIEYPDTIIVLGGIVGTNLNIAATQGLGQNIPNPFDCETRVELSVSQRENVRMQLLDASGKQYADYRGSLGAGVHTFDISAAAPQAYVLNAIVGSHSYSIRMVNMGSGCGSSIKYTGISGSITAKLTSTNEFQNGDNMRYVAYATNDGEIIESAVVEQPQTVSEDITLNFTVCIPLAELVEVTACNSYQWNNETYTESGEYQQTFTAANGCDSVVTLHLTINYSNTGTDEQIACDSYTWIDGNTYTASTNEPTYTLTNAAGCDSVVTLHLTVNYPLAELVEATACDSYEWNNETYNVSGDYQQTFVAANGCDSVVTLHLTINRSNTGIDEQTACDSYTWIDGVTYTESTNEPTFTLTNAEGCDSVVTLHLTINHSNTGIDEQTACDSYTWIDGVTYTESTTEPTFTLTNAVGCDSVVTLHLTINHSNTGIDTQTACDFYTWLDGVTYTESTNEPTFTLTNAAGCDSVVTLHLTINHSNIGIDTQTACDFYTWIDGVTYTESTTEPTFTLTNVEGCDSVVTLHLIINRNTGIDTQSACDSYTWIDGVTYTESTTEPTYTLTNVAGCDSVVTLHLTINHSNTGIYEHTACDSYTWIDGVTYTESTTEPTYTFTNVTGCDSVVTLHLTINHSNTGIDEQTACESYTWIDDVTYTESTNEPTFTLTNAAGCDSVVTLHLTINHSNTGIDEHTACDSYTWIDGVTYTASTNEPTFTLTNAEGCDSVVTLHLTINHSNTGIDEQTACDSYEWIDGVTYTESTNEPTFTLTNSEGCDSVVTLHLTINHNTGIDTQSACDSYTWIDGVTYTENTTEPTYTLTNVAGCDSVVTLHLTINRSDTGIDEQTACDSYTWIDGVVYTESTNESTFTLTNVAGCDSIVILHLTINHSLTEHVEVTTCDSYDWNGETYTESGDYVQTIQTVNGCDSVVTLHLTIKHSSTGTDTQTACGNYTWINGITYTESTNEPTYTLTNAVGCDSVVTLHLTMICPPTIRTLSATSITEAGAILNGNITTDGGTTVTERGFIYGVSASNLTQSVLSGSGNGSFTYTLTGLTPSTTYYYKAYATNSVGTSYGDVMQFTTSQPTTGTLNGHAWIDLGLPSGLRWATCNVGANSPTVQGNHYAWGETTTKNDYSWSNYRLCNGSNSTLTKYCQKSNYGLDGYTDTLTTLETIDDAATLNWGNGWRMPTKDEFEELKDNCTVIWTTQNGRHGRLFTGPNGNSIFLPAADIDNQNRLRGYYWSSSLYTYQNYSLSAYFLDIGSNWCVVNYGYRYPGHSVRPVCMP